MKTIEKHSEWYLHVDRKKFVERSKDYSEVYREFERDKWSRVLDYAKANGISSVGHLEDWEVNFIPVQGTFRGDWYEGSHSEFKEKQFNLIEEILQRRDFFEIGIGMGSNVSRSRYGSKVFGTDISPSACELSKLLCTRSHTFFEASAGFVSEIMSSALKQSNIDTAVTAFVLPYLKENPIDFFNILYNAGIRRLVCMEPLIEDLSFQTSADVSLDYFSKNGYQKFLSYFLQLEKVSVEHHSPCILGINPLLPVSRLVLSLNE